MTVDLPCRTCRDAPSRKLNTKLSAVNTKPKQKQYIFNISRWFAPTKFVHAKHDKSVYIHKRVTFSFSSMKLKTFVSQRDSDNMTRTMATTTAAEAAVAAAAEENVYSETQRKQEKSNVYGQFLNNKKLKVLRSPPPGK